MRYIAALLIGLGLVLFGESGPDDDALAIVGPSLSDIRGSRLDLPAGLENIIRAHGMCNAEFVRARLNGVLVGLEGDAFVVNEWLFDSLSKKAMLDLVDNINCFVMGPSVAGADTLGQIVFVSGATHERLAEWSQSDGLRLRRGEQIKR